MRALLPVMVLTIASGCASAPPKTDETPPVASSAPPATSAVTVEETPPTASVETSAPAPTKPDLPPVTFAIADPSPTPAKLPLITIRAPTKNQVVTSAKAADFRVVVDLKGNKEDVADICVTLDARPCVRIEGDMRPIKLSQLAGDQPLPSGQHVLAAFARRDNRESIKGEGKTAPISIVSFYVDKKSDVSWKDGAPMLQFSTPSIDKDRNLLIDYFVANAKVAEGQYVLHASVTGPGLESGRGEVLTAWKPWRIAHARPGLYTVRLVLLHFQANAIEQGASETSVRYSAHEVGGIFADVTRQIRVDAE